MINCRDVLRTSDLSSNTGFLGRPQKDVRSRSPQQMDCNLTDQQLPWHRIAREFAQQRVAPIAREMDESGEMPLALVEEMAKLGLLGGTIPKEFGGSAMDHLSLALVYEELGRAC